MTAARPYPPLPAHGDVSDGVSGATGYSEAQMRAYGDACTEIRDLRMVGRAIAEWHFALENMLTDDGGAGLPENSPHRAALQKIADAACMLWKSPHRAQAIAQPPEAAPAVQVAVAWRYVPSAVWKDYVLTADPERAALARSQGITVEALGVIATTPKGGEAA